MDIYICQNCGEMVLSEKDVKKCPNCNQLQLKQKKRKIGEVIFSDKE